MLRAIGSSRYLNNKSAERISSSRIRARGRTETPRLLLVVPPPAANRPFLVRRRSWWGAREEEYGNKKVRRRPPLRPAPPTSVSSSSIAAQGLPIMGPSLRRGFGATVGAAPNVRLLLGYRSTPVRPAPRSLCAPPGVGRDGSDGRGRPQHKWSLDRSLSLLSFHAGTGFSFHGSLTGGDPRFVPFGGLPRRQGIHGTARVASSPKGNESETPAASTNPTGGGGNPTTTTKETEISSSTTTTPAPPAASVLSSALVGDQMTVIVVAVLTLLLVLSPALVDRIRNREHYDDFFNFDDPIDDLTLELYRLSREDDDDEKGDADENDEKDGTEGGDSAAPRPKKNVVENLLREVFQSAALQQAAQQFVVATLQSEPVRAALQHLLKELAIDLLQDPETIAQVVQLLNVAIQNDQVRRAAQELVIDLVNDPSVKAALVSVIQRLGQDGAVQEASQELLRDTAHAVLNDEDVMDHSMEFATDVLGDDVVQQTAGEALRNTVGHAVRPAATSAVWGAAGLAWMAVALLAISYANHPPGSSRPSGGGGTGKGLDRALDGMDRTLTLGNGTSNRSLMNLVASLPGHIISVLTWPLRLVGTTLQQPLVALGRTVQVGAASAANWVVSVPSRLAPSRESLSHVPGIVLSAVLWPFERLGRLAGSSFFYVTSGLGKSLSIGSKRVSASVQAGVSKAGARTLQASSSLLAWSIDSLRNLARATWSRCSEATTGTLHRLGRSLSSALSCAATAVASLHDSSTDRSGYVDWLEAWTRRINDALADWALAAEQFIASFASRRPDDRSI